MENHPLLKQLNPKQQEAVKTTEGPVLVLAGAGSGKTRVLTHRIAYLIDQEKARPEEILAVTFTNKAASEIKERIANLLGQQTTARQLPWAGTFHSICAKILRRDGQHAGIPPGFTIYDPTDQKAVVKEILKKMDLDPKKFKPNAVLGAISGAKNELVTPDGFRRFAQGIFQETIAEIYPQYQKVLDANQALDFDDLLMKTIMLFDNSQETLEKYQNLFKYILIDEYQDTNYAQYTLTKVLAKTHHNIFVVGDDAQSIYRWRGADIRNILNFENDYDKVKVIKLEQNYRSTKTILEASNHVISQNKNQKKKKLWTDNADGDLIQIYESPNERDEARFIAQQIKEISDSSDDIAILYRTNAQSRVLEETMINYNIPYRLVGNVRFYDRKEIKDILGYLRLIANPKDNISLIRVINTPKRGIGKQTIEKLRLLSASSGMSMLEAIDNVPEIQLDAHFSSRQQTQLKKFSKLIHEIRSKLEKFDLIDFLKYILEETKILEEYGDKTEENMSRIENIKEFINIATKFKNQPAAEVLEQFLEDIALVEDQARRAEENPNEDKVTLMTIHAAKGLEFKHVFVTGLEENIFPHSRSYAEPEELEEERRLAYVAFTRAKEELILTYASKRMFMGSRQDSIRSRFIDELPQELTTYMNDFGPMGGWQEVVDDNKFRDYDSPQIDIHPGERVRSEFFGIGTVLSVDEDIIKIQFESGIKELSTEYARLEKI